MSARKALPADDTDPAAPRPGLPEARVHVENFRQVREARRAELVEDYVELISDLIADSVEARQVDIAERLGVAQPTVQRMLQRLVRDGLAAMVPDREDGRGKLVRLTTQGLAFMQEILPRHYLRISKLMGRLSEAEQDVLIRLLKKVASH